MYVIVATLYPKPEYRDALLDAEVDNARSSVADEPGCLRFDVHRDQSDPDLIHVYEVYRDEDDFQAHLQTSHLLHFRETTKDWRAAPTEAHFGVNLFPKDDSWA